jgi:uncharacterized protein YebE (UPF0316 family)
MDYLVWTLVIFFARVLDVSLGTIRVQFIFRRKKVLAALTGFVEVLIFIVVVSQVIRDIQHWPYVLAYAGGFATGTLLGMYLSEKLSRRVVQTTVICNGPQEELETAVREAGFALTRHEGIGRDGAVSVIDVVCSAVQLSDLITVVYTIAPKAFLYTHELAGMRGGFVYGVKGKL